MENSQNFTQKAKDLWEKIKNVVAMGAALVLVGIILLSLLSAFSAQKIKNLNSRDIALREYQAAAKALQKRECDLIQSSLRDYGNQLITADPEEVARWAYRNEECA